MERRQFTREFKLEAVRLIKQRGVLVCAGVKRSWCSSDPAAQLGEAAGGRSAARISRPRSDEAGAVGDRAAQAQGAKLKAERDILKKAAAYFAKKST